MDVRAALLTSALALAPLAAGAQHAHVPGALWDGFIVVSAAAFPDGRLLYCKEGRPSMNDPRGPRCYNGSLLLPSSSPGQILTLQQVLDLEMRPRDGKRPIAIGVLPTYVRSGGKVVNYQYNEGQLVIAYRYP